MNKQAVVEAVAKRLGVTRARAGEITDLFFSQTGIIASELKRGGKVAISGFGNFELRRRAAREGTESADREGARDQGLGRPGVPGRQGLEGNREPEALTARAAGLRIGAAVAPPALPWSGRGPPVR